MPYKLYLQMLIVFIIVVFLFVIGFNFYFDSFGVFRMTQPSITRNPKHTKIEYLNANPSVYDTFIFGGSRVGVIEPKDVEKYIPGSNVYNMFYFLNDEQSNQKIIHYLIQTQHIKRILMQISFDELDRFNQADALLYSGLHYQVSGQSQLLYYAERLLSLLPLKQLIETKFNAFRTTILNEKMPFNDGLAVNIQSGVLTHFPKPPTVFPFAPSQFGNLPLKDVQSSLQAIRNIVTMCKANDIKLIVWITPERYDKMLAYDPIAVSTFKSALRKITPYRDFSISSKITLTPENYYDQFGHYKEDVGQLILKEIFLNENQYSVDYRDVNE